MKIFRYLGVCLDRGMRGKVHLEKMREKAENEGQELAMSRVNREMEVDRGRLIWKLLARPCLEHASEVWQTGGKAACKNLENFKRTLAGDWWEGVVQLQGL